MLTLMVCSQPSHHCSDLLPAWPFKCPFQIGRRKRSGGAFPILSIRALIKAFSGFYLSLSSLPRSQLDSVLLGLGDINVSVLCNTESLLTESEIIKAGVRRNKEGFSP